MKNLRELRREKFDRLLKMMFEGCLLLMKQCSIIWEVINNKDIIDCYDIYG